MSSSARHDRSKVPPPDNTSNATFGELLLDMDVSLVERHLRIFLTGRYWMSTTSGITMEPGLEDGWRLFVEVAKGLQCLPLVFAERELFTLPFAMPWMQRRPNLVEEGAGRVVSKVIF